EFRRVLFRSRHERDEGARWAGDVPSAVRAAVALLAPQKDLRAIRVASSVPSSLPPVSMPQDALAQLLLNLLLNAADALGERGGEVRVDARPAGARVRLVGEDDGPGFTAAHLPHDFEPHFTTAPVGAGAGLGLSVAQTLVHRAEGTIVAENRPEGGARFSIELPLAVLPRA